MGWLTGWTYRKSVTLSRASGAVTNYQMKLLVGESSGATGKNVDCGRRCLSTFNDLRFTKADGTTLLDYWIESISGTTPNQLATVWIEFDFIGTSATTFYMYYGKADATAGSNGSNTFLFFDDFARENSDTVGNGWTESVDVFSIENGTLKNINPSDSDADRLCYKSFSSWGSSFCFEARIKLPELVASHSVVTELVNNGNQRMVLGIEKTSVRYFLNTWVSIDTNSGDWIILGSIFDSVNTKVAYAVNRTIKASNVSLASASGYQNIIKISTYWRSSLSYVDWVLVRQYLATEPAWGTWGAWEGQAGPASYLTARRDRMNMRPVSTQNQLE